MVKYKTKNKLKIKTPTWNNKFDLLDGSFSVTDFQDYIGHMTKYTNNYLIILLFMFTSIELIVVHR